MGIKVFCVATLLYLLILFKVIGFKRIQEVVLMYVKKSYWTDYNTIEFAAWFAKAIIIIPGLIFGIEIWQFHFLTLLTSSLLIWASMRKKLPTLIVFNIIWIMISLFIITRNLIAF
jgi:hypothetical protein